MYSHLFIGRTDNVREAVQKLISIICSINKMNCSLMCFYSFQLFRKANKVRIKRQLINTVIISKIMATVKGTAQVPWETVEKSSLRNPEVIDLLPDLTGMNRCHFHKWIKMNMIIKLNNLVFLRVHLRIKLSNNASVDILTLI